MTQGSATDAGLYALAERLFPLKRTVQGFAVMETLGLLKSFVGQTFAWTHVPVGTKVFDWTVLADKDNRRAYHPTLDEVPYPVRMEPNLVVEFYSR